MQHAELFAFTSELLKKLHISSHVLEDPKSSIPSTIDNGLRAMLFGENNYSNILASSPTEACPNVIYRFFDEYLCNYLFFKIPNRDNDSYFFIGPYLPSLPTEDFFAKKARQLSLGESRMEQFRAYYRNLPIVEDENVILSIADTLGIFLWDGADNFNIEYIAYEIPDRRKPVYTDSIFDSGENTTPALTLELLEQTYQNEKELMDAVSKGKLNKIDIIVSSVQHRGMEDRLDDSLRNRKNYLIILNTLLRKAAQYGGVHPFHIHKLSSRFARKIEQLYSVNSSLELQKEMIRKYCILVKEHSLKQYSQLVGRVITLIAYDLSADLSLKAIASTLNVNASYLSAAFKKECGETLTDYVCRKRMDSAAYILSHTGKQVQTVAEECGIWDVNYFIKLFKKLYAFSFGKP